MTTVARPRFRPAWYFGTRAEFLAASRESVANQLAGRAIDEGLETEPQQGEEWKASVEILQRSLDEQIPILRQALSTPACESIRHIILEFDFRRRGLRMDCILLSDGALFVLEFKRSSLDRAARDQVMAYGVNLLEFHRVTRNWCESHGAIIVPILIQTQGRIRIESAWPGTSESWPFIARNAIECDGSSLGQALATALRNCRSNVAVSANEWLDSPFDPSSSILDATLSLYGNHDVAAIKGHAAAAEQIASSTAEIRQHIETALSQGAYHIVFLSGAPGAGKTLVGLDIAMRGNHAENCVFVTGNAPLVDVLNKALEKAYTTQGRSSTSWPTGYHRKDAKLVASAATFKIVKAHNFLGERGHMHQQQDGRVIVFDEAQRTYEKGRTVLSKKLPDHEADLILQVQREAFPVGGAVVVALVGHNQAINRGERGIVAWLEAAARNGWTFSIDDETLELAGIQERERWAKHPGRQELAHGHLRQSLRYYRNTAVESWVASVLDGNSMDARNFAASLDQNSATISITRSLHQARKWVWARVLGNERAGIIASGQARRLAADGLFVDYKPDITTWMLAPTTDIRSSNALETVQNQYQIQGLELDYCIACWDADLRRENGVWRAYKLKGSDWENDGMLNVAKNGYRVVLTRARKGMIIFVPSGDQSGEDPTRMKSFYDGIAAFLAECGAKSLEE